MRPRESHPPLYVAGTVNEPPVYNNVLMPPTYAAYRYAERRRLAGRMAP